MTKLKIDNGGWLWVLRKNTLKRQYCMYDLADRCGDSCPHFREPEVDEYQYSESLSIKGEYQYSEGLGEKYVCLRLCQGLELIVNEDEFIDERKYDED